MSDQTPNLSVPVVKSTHIEMRPLICVLRFDDDGQRTATIQYGEYHDGVLHRPLALQQAPPEKANPVLDGVWAAMEAAVEETIANVNGALPPEEWGPNEHYVAGVLALAVPQEEEE